MFHYTFEFNSKFINADLLCFLIIRNSFRPYLTLLFPLGICFKFEKKNPKQALKRIVPLQSIYPPNSPKLAPYFHNDFVELLFHFFYLLFPNLIIITLVLFINIIGIFWFNFNKHVMMKNNILTHNQTILIVFLNLIYLSWLFSLSISIVNIIMFSFTSYYHTNHTNQPSHPFFAFCGPNKQKQNTKIQKYTHSFLRALFMDNTTKD